MTATFPRLTIVIPTLNRAYCLPRAIDSALAQTHPDVEIIVSDNGSTDNTPEIMARYSDPRLRTFRRDTTIPACAHGNFLIEQARGELFLGLSDDDFIEPEFAARVIDRFESDPSLSFVYTGCNIHFADVLVPAKVGPPVEPGPHFIAAFLGGKRDVCWCACVTRTAGLRRIGPIPEGTRFGDMFYWTRLAFEGNVGCVADPVASYIAYRLGGDNISAKTSVSEWASEVRMLVEQMVGNYWKATGSFERLAAVRRDADEFIARSTADQFVWTALRGASRQELLRAVLPSLTFLLPGRGPIWVRVIAAILGSRDTLRRNVLAGAAHKARQVSVQNGKMGEALRNASSPRGSSV